MRVFSREQLNAAAAAAIASSAKQAYNCGIMNTPINRMFAAMVALCALASGCGQLSGWVLKPVPLDESLKETVLATDPGLFVTDKIVVVDVDGMLFNQRPEASIFGWRENPVALFVEKLDKVQGDKNVKAVVLRINSPGGSVTASDIMYARLMTLRKRRGIPVVAILEDVGASGAYYLACGADTILAHPTSVTGSIGVIVQTVSFAGTMKLLGIEAKAVTSGARKDMASPLKPLDEEDLAILKEMVDGFYERFLGVVAASRTKLKPARLRELADGRVFTGEQALKAGLVDGVGYMSDAIALARTKADIKRAKVIMYHRPIGYRANVYSTAPPVVPQVNLLNLTAPDLAYPVRPQFLYLWTGHTTRGG